MGTKFSQESAKSRDTVGNYRYQVGLNHQLRSKLRIVTLSSFLFFCKRKSRHLRSTCFLNGRHVRQIVFFSCEVEKLTYQAYLTVLQVK